MIATLVAAIALPLSVQAAKGERRNKSDAAVPAFDTVDKSKDGTISKEEFVAAMKEKLGEEGAKTRFDTLDKNTDGKLSKEEYAAAGGEAKKKRKKNSN